MIYVAWLTRTVGYFLLGDSLNTTITLIYTLEYTEFDYDAITLTYLLLVAIFAQVSSDIFTQTSIRGKETDLAFYQNKGLRGLCVLLVSKAFQARNQAYIQFYCNLRRHS